MSGGGFVYSFSLFLWALAGRWGSWLYYWPRAGVWWRNTFAVCLGLLRVRSLGSCIVFLVRTMYLILGWLEGRVIRKRRRSWS
jgi:hypothetical protein